MPIVTNSGGQAALFKGNDSCYIMQKRPLESANGYNYEVCCRPGSYDSNLAHYGTNNAGGIINDFRPWADYEKRHNYIYENGQFNLTDFQYNTNENVQTYFGANGFGECAIKGTTGMHNIPHTTLPAYRLNDKFFNATTIDIYYLSSTHMGTTEQTHFYGPQDNGVYQLRHHCFVGLCHPVYCYGRTDTPNCSTINAGRYVRYMYDTNKYIAFRNYTNSIYRKSEKSVKTDGIQRMKSTYNITKKDLDMMPRQMFYYTQLFAVVGIVSSKGWYEQSTWGKAKCEHKLHKYYAVNNGENYFDKYVDTKSYFYCNIFPQYRTNQHYLMLNASEYSNNAKSGFTKIVKPSTSDWRYPLWNATVWRDFEFEAPSVAGVVKDVLFFSGAMDYIKKFDIVGTGAIEIGDETATGKTVIRQRFPYVTIPNTGRSAIKGIYFKGGFEAGNADFRFIRTSEIKCYWCCNMSSNDSSIGYYKSMCNTVSSGPGVHGGSAFLDTIYKYEIYDVPKYSYTYYPFSYIDSTKTTNNYNYEAIECRNYRERSHSGGVTSAALTGNNYNTDLIIVYKNGNYSASAIKGSNRNVINNNGLFIDAVALYKTLEGWGLVTKKNSGASTDDAATKAKKAHVLLTSEFEAIANLLEYDERIKCYMRCLGTDDYLKYKPEPRDYTLYGKSYNNDYLFVDEWRNGFTDYDTYLLPFAVRTELNYSSLRTIGTTITGFVTASGHTFRANSALLYSGYDSDTFYATLHSWELCKHYNFNLNDGCSPIY